MKTPYDSIAKNFSDTRVYPWKEFSIFHDYCHSGDAFLDIGCGNGRLIASLENYREYIGIDNSKNLLAEAVKKHPDKTFFYNSMTDLSVVEGKKFDVIFFIASFHHLETEAERLLCLKKVKKLLTDDGVICLTNWNLFQKKYKKYIWKAMFHSLFSSRKWNDTFIPFTKNNQEKIWRYYHAFSPKELQGLYRKSGFVIKEEQFFKKGVPTHHWKESWNICHVIAKNNNESS
ncbi:hypothetical protein COB57_01630 [Candidatus Peregrinibacteria bacterium]|nr:MAG: hypothetical protein COB57_01630 [Candidatus Peregrinibacteria bacterium]